MRDIADTEMLSNNTLSVDVNLGKCYIPTVGKFARSYDLGGLLKGGT